ncbi:hypothetical protein HZP71_02360 [Elizabethkingia anophelis]|nr:hypothetical protein [Elizabethkingia anophelis]MCT3679058.1 hypothetical protein [Elizabethkingia anophelis]MCT4121486.1 hypothetical protein [Elizabethkingia anophelis]MDV3668196.1 hypothetical protein [Elizabethkingia anophelis]
MEKTTFVKETDNKGRTYIIEGWIKPGNIFSIKCFVCQVQERETEKETEDLADFIIESLKKAEKWDALDKDLSKFYEEDSDGDLGSIGEVAARAFKYL